MKFLKIAVSFLVALVIVFFAVSFFLPSETHIERTIEIQARDSVVFKLISEHKEFQKWSPWAKIDPAMETIFSGPEVGIGSKITWKSDHSHVGNGTSVYTQYEPNVGAATELLFDQGGGLATFNITQVEGKPGVLKVTWGFDTVNTSAVEKYFGLMMDGMLGPMYEEGLVALKEIAEGTTDEIESSRAGVVTREISYSVEGVSLTGYAARPADDGVYPGVIVVHEWWGHNDYARKRAEMLAAQGYSVFALDMYGDGKVADHPDQAKEFMTAVAGNIELAKTRFLAAVNILQEQPGTDKDKLAAFGYCFGGSVALNMARSGLPLDGVVSFHGGLGGLVPIAEKVDTQFMVYNGAADPFVKEEHKAAFRKDMDTAGLSYTLVDFPGVQHSFTVEGADEIGAKHGLPFVYNKEADVESWLGAQKFLAALFEN